MKSKTGIYIHIPFCKSKCRYCDFVSFANMEKYMEEYTKSLCDEIRKTTIAEPINTIFIGGGTPTSLSYEMLVKICEEILKKELAKEVEFTVEVNPDTVDMGYLLELKKIGVNRLSFGLQSCNNDTLKFLGRTHNYETFEKVYKEARAVGFENINIDLMYNLPRQDLENFEQSLDKIIDLNPEHISAYSLIIEEGTPFHKMVNEGQMSLPNEELYIEFNEICEKKLKLAGYFKYEVSNYAKKGFECKHNIIYWELDNYYGFGLNAHSKIGNKRYSNTINLDDYIEGTYDVHSEILNIEEQEDEFIFLGLRMTKGLDKKKYKELFNKDFDIEFKDKLLELEKDNYIVDDEEKIYVTSKGFHILNHIISKIIL